MFVHLKAHVLPASMSQGNVTLEPWDKRFIDTVLAANDPLSLTLKSAYDNKLKVI